MTGEGQDPPSAWRRPSPEDFPRPDATLEELVRFARSTDPTEHFRALWGDEYSSKVRDLWNRCVEAHRAGQPASARPDELAMCLNYDLTLGPYLGVGGPHKLPFLQWLIEGIRFA